MDTKKYYYVTGPSGSWSEFDQDTIKVLLLLGFIEEDKVIKSNNDTVESIYYISNSKYFKDAK